MNFPRLARIVAAWHDEIPREPPRYGYRRPMLLPRALTVTLALSASVAAAHPSELEVAFDNLLMGDQYLPATGPKFAFVGGKAVSGAATYADQFADLPQFDTTQSFVEGHTSDRAIAWVASDVVWMKTVPNGPDPDVDFHAVVLFEHGKDWLPVAFAITPVVPAKAQADANKKGIVPPAIPRNVEASAEDAVKLFEATIGDPKGFAKTVSDRKEVVLFGSEAAERFAGGAKVRAKLVAWNLTFKVRDGVQAGATKTLAWVAANVDAVPVRKPKAAPQPYRAFVLYEKTGNAWKLVAASFSVVTVHS
jgi:hypothetical protein